MSDTKDIYTNRPPMAGVVLGRDETDFNLTKAIRINSKNELVVGGSTANPSADFYTEETFFEANTDTAEYDTGDRIVKRERIDTSGATAPVVTWLNLTQGTTIAEPPASHLTLLGSSGLTDTELRASDVGVIDQTVVDKLDELKTEINNIFNNVDDLEAFSNAQIQLLQTLNEYNDGVESLLGTLGDNTDDLEALTTQLGLNTQSTVDEIAGLREDQEKELANWAYTYTADANNNITSETRTATIGNTVVTETRTFTWDANSNIQSISAYS